MTVRTRFSPSPTGMIHLGNVRTALFSALFAAKHRGTFILRIEDTDVSRSEERFVDSLQENLHWLGITWEEGPGVGGNVGPYWQSQRQTIYDKFYQVLEDKHLIYPCFCTDQDLLLVRKRQLSQGKAPRYAGTCRRLSETAINRKLSEGYKPAWRFTVPTNQTIAYVDVVKGKQSFQSDDIGDFIIRRADGTAPFLFCNAIDDAMMQVTHVLRGEDHVANTPRQIMLLQALALTLPHYGHLSLITGDDGAPLSKRHGSYSLQDMREKGFLPAALMNYLARLGHVCTAQTILDFEHLAAEFDLEKISRSPARFDPDQLRYWQKMAVQMLDTAAFRRWLGEKIENQVPEETREQFAETIRLNIVFPPDALMWSRIFFHEGVQIDHDALNIVRAAGEQFFVEAEQAVDKHGVNLVLVLDDMKQTLGIQGKKLYMPMRVALTGKTYGPELIQIAELLGKEKMKYRLGQAFQCASHSRTE